jgi:exodeoxyribonuclease VII large subunit
LARTLKTRVEDEFPATWVRGELVNVKRYPSGHLYFSLRDDLARVDCTMWRSAAARLRDGLEEGSEVFALGTPSVWEERTALRFNVVQVLPAAAVGAAAQQVERIKQRLLADGLLDPARKRPLPPYPARVAVITSTAGAAVRDVITVARTRWPVVELVVIGAAVQGEHAATELVAAFGVLDALPGVDLCIVGRGGGAKEDLAAFNDEAVCRAIAGCRVPVISAVGHEVDVTLADLVADLRAATPSQAAEFALPDWREVASRLATIEARLGRTTTERLARRGERLERTRDRMANALAARLRSTERRLDGFGTRLGPALERRVRLPRERLARVAERLRPAIDRRIAAGTADIARLAAWLRALSPLEVLARGYALPRDPDGAVLRRTIDFVPGARFTLTVSDGSIPARVEDA